MLQETRGLAPLSQHTIRVQGSPVFHGEGTSLGAATVALQQGWRVHAAPSSLAPQAGRANAGSVLACTIGVKLEAGLFFRRVWAPHVPGSPVGWCRFCSHWGSAPQKEGLRAGGCSKGEGCSIPRMLRAGDAPYCFVPGTLCTGGMLRAGDAL